MVRDPDFALPGEIGRVRASMTALSAERPLLNRRILLAVTGSIAACRADRVIRELQDRGADVQVLITEAGARFFPPDTAGAFTDHPVLRHQFEDTAPGRMVHIEAKREADAVLVAPATANRLLQLEQPRADDTLGTVLQAFTGPVIYAPAMNPDMWNHPNLREVVQRHAGGIVEPLEERVACGDVGPGHLAEPSRIAEAVVRVLWPNALEGERWVISGGPTREAWDDIRFLSNRSSGRMGEALALVGDRLGGEIVLITGAERNHYPSGNVRTVQIESTRELLEQALEWMDESTSFMGAAAVSDYRPRRTEGKIKSGQEDLSMPLEKNPNVIGQLRSEYPEATLIGFSADDREEPSRAFEKMRERKLQGVVFNSIRQTEGGFGQESNRAVMCMPPDRTFAMGQRPKLELALQIWSYIQNYELD